MNTKTLLITAAAALAAGIMSSQAQVYSQNVVGYVNVGLTNTGVANGTYLMVANQLDADGTGTNNSIYNVVGTNLPVNTQVLCWNPSSGTFSSTKLTGAGKWTLNNQIVTNAMNPGGGFFINCPLASGQSTNITFVGNVIQGTNLVAVSSGYQIVSPLAPVAGGIQTTNGYSPTKNDQVLVWNNGTGTYSSHKYTGTTWTGGEPAFNVGQGFFLNAAAATTWTNVLVIQ
jgi:hypothetical protein